MLGDQAEKKPQTFKSAIRTIKRKTVAFAPPTYVDYSDFDDYSSDEEDLDELFADHTSTSAQTAVSEEQKAQEKQASQSAEDDTASEDSARVEPLKPRSNKEVRLVEPSVETVVEEDETRNSEEILLDTKLEPSRSRNGTVRNTDSFFKDETVETKKITLTPNLLRDDNQPRQSTESVVKETAKVRPSLERDLMSDREKKKLKDKDRKEKEKKPSAIRSFFSRKDKKKTTDDDDESFGKRSMDIQSDSVGRSSESPSIEEQTGEKPQRSPSKLQKQMPRVEPSANRRGSGDKTGPSPTMELVAYLNESRTNDVSNVPPATMRIVDSETNETQELPSNHANAMRERSASAAAQREDKAAAAKVVARSASTGVETKSKTRTRPKTDLDDFSSDDDLDFAMEPETRATTEPSEAQQVPGAFPDETEPVLTRNEPAATTNKSQQRLSESPVQVSPVNGSQPPALEIDTSSLEGRSSEEVPSPQLSHGDDLSKDSASSRSSKEPGWDDEKLREFFDDGDHVRDLLMVVYDKTDAEPVSEHPVVSGLFREQNAKLAEITTVSRLVASTEGKLILYHSNWTTCSGTGWPGNSDLEAACRGETRGE